MGNWLKTHRNDILLVGGLLVLSGALALFLFITRQAGGRASIQIDGELVAELPLGQDTQIVLGEGEHTNTLVIQGGTAQVVEASCPDQVCVRQGAIRYAGESIVCLPHRLVVTVEGGTSTDVDATAK